MSNIFDYNDKERFIIFLQRGEFKEIGKMIETGIQLPKGCLSMAVASGNSELINRIIKTPFVTTNDLNTSLYEAIQLKNWPLAHQLLDTGADPNYEFGLTRIPLLFFVICTKNILILELFLTRGASPNAYDTPVGAELLGTPVGRTALMVAAEMGYLDGVRLLLKFGADPWRKGEKGKTAMELVVRRKGREAVAGLLTEWMRDHPQTLASTSAPELLNPSKLFTSWDDGVQRLEKATSGKGTPHPQAKSVIRFPLSLEVATVLAGKAAGGKPFDNYRNALATVQDLSVNLDASWFLQFEPGQGAFLCGLAKGDKWSVLRAFKTACANFGVTHTSLLKFLKSMDAEQPFDLVECDFNSVGGRFRGMLPRPEETAQRLFEFCPFVAEDEAGSVKRLAKKLAKTGDFKIWWD